jgi:hypothetical protein
MVHFGAVHHRTVRNGAVLPKSRKRVFKGRLDPNYVPKMREKGNNYALGGWNTLPVKPTGR